MSFSNLKHRMNCDGYGVIVALKGYLPFENSVDTALIRANERSKNMQTLIIHNQDGNVILTQSGSFTMPESVGMVVADVPAGQMVDFVNVTTGEVILKELPKSETEQRLDSMEAALAALVGGEDNG